MKIKLFLFFVLFFISSNSLSVDEINDICKEGSQKLKDYYFDNKEYPAKNFPMSSESYIPTIINAIDTKNINSLIKDKNFLKSYGKHIIIFVFFLLCGFLSILGIFVCCFNYLCCNCSFCFLKKCCVRSISFLVTICIFGSIIFICFYGVATAKESIIGFNNVACSLLKFVSDIIDGQSKNSFPKWVGINNLTDTFDDIKDNLNESQVENGENFYTNYDDFIEKQKNYSEFIKNKSYENNNKDGSGIFHFTLEKSSFKYLDNDITLTPSYIKNWENKITYPNDNLVISEHLTLTNMLLRSMKICEKNSKGYDCTKESIIYKELTKGTTHIYKLQNTISDLESNLVEPFYDYEKMLNDYGKKYVKYVFYVIMLISGFLTVFIIILNCDCDSKMNCVAKILLYIFWILISIIMIISFILGGLLGIIGNVSKDLTYVIGKVLDEDNLNNINPVILKGDGVKYINICLYDKDKNLANAFLLNSNDDSSSSSSSDVTVTDFLAEIPSLYEKLLLDKKKLENINDSTIFDNLKNEINKSIEQCLNIDYYNFNDDLSFHNMTKYLDIFNGFTCKKYNSSCPVNDYWTTSDSDENNIYKLENNFYENKDCSFDGYKFSSLNDAANNILEFLDEINKNNNDTKNKLNMDDNYVDMQNEYKNVLDVLKNATDFAIILTGSIAKSYRSLLGGGQFSQLLDCGFIKDDLNILLNELHSTLANSLIKFGTTFCIISCLIAIGICMMLLTLTLSNESKEEKKKVYNKNRKNVINKYQNNEVNSERMILKENK